jgi:hypothetical protein
MTREEAFKQLGEVIIVCVPEDTPDWTQRRKMLREAALLYCSTAVNEAIVATFALIRASTEIVE